MALRKSFEKHLLKDAKREGLKAKKCLKCGAISISLPGYNRKYCDICHRKKNS